MQAKESALSVENVVASALASADDKGRMKARWSFACFSDPDDKVAKASRGIVIAFKPLRIRLGIKRGCSHSELMRRFHDRLLTETSFEYNLLLNEGINEVWTILCSAGGVKFDNANANIGVGDSATAADATQTGLQAATNKLYKAMDGGYPTYGSAQKATWRSTFGSAEANWVWNEITVCNTAADTGKNLNRKVQAMGTKASGTTWVATLEITFS
jgi:hypothetical protein